MIKQNEAVFKRKKKEEPRGGVVQDFNRALRLLSLHFDNCITALNTSPAVRSISNAADCLQEEARSTIGFFCLYSRRLKFARFFR